MSDDSNDIGTLVHDDDSTGSQTGLGKSWRVAIYTDETEALSLGLRAVERKCWLPEFPLIDLLAK